MLQFIGGNHLQLLKNGTGYFPALHSAISHAEHEIYIQTYIYANDAVGSSIGNALKAAAQRGVSVNLLLDGFGSKELPASYVQELERAGVKVMFYRPRISPLTLKKTRLRRLHRKVVVIDSRIGFVGGINIIDDHNVPNQAPPRIDYAVRIEGPLLPYIVASTHKLWRRIAWVHMRALKLSFSPEKPLRPAQPAVQSSVKSAVQQVKHPSKQQTKNPVNANVTAAFVVRDNILHRRDIEQAYMDAIATAQAEIFIANAYFVPGRRFRKALLAAAARGVSVKLLLQGRKEYFLMFATYAFYSEFLAHGIEIYEYRKSFMHSKVAVIDHSWATVGSSNIDPFSLLLGREANVVVQNSAFATELRTDLAASVEDGAYQISAQEWSRGNVLKRFFSWLAYGMVRLFLGAIGHSHKQ
jgi:cardiolipin synthase